MKNGHNYKGAPSRISPLSHTIYDARKDDIIEMGLWNQIFAYPIALVTSIATWEHALPLDDQEPMTIRPSDGYFCWRLC